MNPEDFRDAIQDMQQVRLYSSEVPEPTRFRDLGSRVDDTLDTRDIIVTSPYLSYGDYDNSTAVERSNVATVQAMVEEGVLDEDAVVEVYGSMGGISLGFRYIDEDSAETIVNDILDPLESYPLLDEEAHSEMEMEMYQEAWLDYGAGEFVDKIVADMEYEDDDDEEAVDEFLRGLDPVLLFEAFDTVGEAWGRGLIMVEGGGSVYFDFREAFRDKTGFDYYEWLQEKQSLGGPHGPWEDDELLEG